jgi:EAL domain-containing protein (putative c-di-GMP-specific phosphodiesterase class I)
LSINLSVKQMLENDIVEDIRKAALKYNIPFKNVNLEITESIFIDEIERTAQTIQILKSQEYPFQLIIWHGLLFS